MERVNFVANRLMTIVSEKDWSLYALSGKLS